MHIVVCGHVTRDLIAGEARLGGAASFAASAACHLGARTSLLTSTIEPFDLAAPLRRTPGLVMHVVPSAEATTFELSYDSGRRRIRLLARARDLFPSDLPASFVGADAAYVAPVISECELGLVSALRASWVAAGLQGWLRAIDEHRGIVARVPADLVRRLAGVRVCVFSAEDHPEAEQIAARLAEAGKLVALTRAEHGATLYSREGSTMIPAVPASEVDPTGAGDVFGLVFTVGLARGLSPRDAAELAAIAGARVVEGPGLGNFPTACAGWQW
jgi:sugar/nucleoside kinase (ribokinase family)